MPKPQLFLVAGVNGSGKSTLTKTLLQQYPSLTVIDPDAIAKQLSGSTDKINSQSVSAGKAAIRAVQNCIQNKDSFIIESTISGNIYLRYLEKAKENGFELTILYVALASDKISADRVAARVHAGGHNIPMADIKRRYPKSFRNLKAHLQLCDLGYIYDNSEKYRLIAHYRNGVIEHQSELPNWIAPYI